MKSMRIAALFVAENGCYFGLEHVDPWSRNRDARTYVGPWPVVAHPPCERWGRYWHGAPNKPHQYKLGDDDGCFAAALSAVRKFGGVIEHPAHSHAWGRFGLPLPPKSGGWVGAAHKGWSCHVEQGHYGHFARKPTWLYAFGMEPPILRWGPSEQRLHPVAVAKHGYEKARRIGVMAMIGGKNKKQIREATPLEFRDLLITIAQSTNEINGLQYVGRAVDFPLTIPTQRRKVRTYGSYPGTALPIDGGPMSSHEEITIQGQSYKVPLRYKAGDVLKDNEATALNQLLHNNLRNNFSQKVVKAQKEAEASGGQVDVAALQQQLDEFSQRYEFGMRLSRGGAVPVDPAEHLALVRARDIVRRAAKDKGLNWTAAQIEEASKQLLAKQGPDGALITAARQQLEAEKSVAGEMLAEVMPAQAA